MRLAVALPSYERGSLHGRSLDAMVAALAASGVEIEGFAEHDRLDGNAPFEVFHYLRMPERHQARSFDLALYPMGRDAGPYQGVFSLMQRFPSVVWFLDPVMQHFAIGGIALYDEWADYREIVDAAHGAAGAAVAQSVARGWATGALLRRYDIVALLAKGQQGVLAAWPSLADRLATASGRSDIGVVGLGLVEGPESWEVATEAGSPRSAAIMALNEAYVDPALRAAGEILEACDDAEVSICINSVVYAAAAASVAERLGINDRVRWELSPSWERLAEVARRSGILLWFAEELQGAHRLLLLHGLTAGRLTLVPRTSLYDDLPDGAVAKIDLGAALAPTVREVVRTAFEEPAFADGLARAARRFASSYPDVDAAAAKLGQELERRRDCAPRAAPVSGATWETVAAGTAAAATPGGASGAGRRAVSEVLAAHNDLFLRVGESERDGERESS